MPPPWGPSSRIRVAVAGATGFIGSALVADLRRAGHEVRRLVRDPHRRGPLDVLWDPGTGALLAKALEGMDCVVNLAGETIAQRWTDSAKRRIRESRVTATDLLARSIASLATPPSVFLSASAIGYYGADRGDDILDESSVPGTDFLASVSQAWEAAARPAAAAGTRVAHARMGVVLSQQGGALAKMTIPFRVGMGGRIGHGRQWMSWVALDDVVGALLFAMSTDVLRGPFNVVAPNAVRNEDFAHALGKSLHRPSLVPLPAIAVRLALGEMGTATILGSTRAVPRALQTAGYQFRWPDLSAALACA
ncbi:MAG: hypothetical protein NVS4B3_07830 [Gemmatimonadaceae bacterium]